MLRAGTKVMDTFLAMAGKLLAIQRAAQATAAKEATHGTPDGGQAGALVDLDAPPADEGFFAKCCK
jgi:hypothetical protein